MHAIIGKGPIGTAAARLLLRRGHDVRVLSRSGGSAAAGAESVALDATDATAVTEAVRGAAVVYNCANPAYDKWDTDWPPLAAALLDAAERTGAVLATVGNLYGYGPVNAPMTEATPLSAVGHKGKIRNRMWADALDRHRAGRVRVTEVRGSDYVGPGVTDQGHLGQRAVPALLEGRTVRVFGDPDAPHSWTAVDDVALALVTAGSDPQAWGRSWHVPTAPPVSARQAVGMLCAAAGVPPVKVAPIPPLLLRAAGVVSPMARELGEVRHQFTGPFVLDSTAFTAQFGVTATPLPDTFAETVRWWRERLAEPAAS